MPHVHTKGIETYYEEKAPSVQGSFPAVVLIHGHSADLRMWQLQTLALVAAGFRVVGYDVRGHGKSSTPASGYTWENYSADLFGLMEAVCRREAVHLVGASMGGGIALQFALDHAERVLSLSLVDAALPGFAYGEEFSARVSELVEAVRQEGVRPALERLWLSDPLFDGLRRFPERFEMLKDIVLEYRASDYMPGAIPEDYAPSLTDHLSEIAAPTLVIAGEGDIPDFRLIAEILASNLPSARLLTFPGCGHLPPLEAPDAFNEALIAFLRGQHNESRSAGVQ